MLLFIVHITVLRNNDTNEDVWRNMRKALTIRKKKNLHNIWKCGLITKEKKHVRIIFIFNLL